MADGVEIADNTGSGVKAATDDAGAAGHVQIFKLAIDSDGVATLAPVTANGVEVEQHAYTSVDTGEFAPGTSAAVFPTVAAKLVRFKARAANAGKVYVGPSGVTKADGTTDTTTGLELEPGDDTGWLPCDNVDTFYGIGDNATDSVTYMVLA